LGDVTLHAHTDEVFFINVISALLQIAENDFLKWHVFIVGGGGQSRYENLVSFRNAIQLHFNRITATKKIIVDTKILSWNLQESFFAMMQAHIVVGSGSSFVHAAHLFSNFPIFLNHEPKHGFNHGLEMMTDSVDMNRNGQILDSLRRIRITFRNKFFGLSQRGPPCRVPT
jgi:dihydroxyacetone kinase-like predicted kinase